jgi:hypothetical protein
MAPLQGLTVKPIEDPAEQAAIDERLKRSEKAVSEDFTSVSGVSAVPGDVETSSHPTDGTRQMSELKRSTPTRRSTRERR